MGAKKIAIACQGGGTHAAFSWGVLTEILKAKKAWDASSEAGDSIDIIAVSGTSAGALCAMATWYGLVPNKADPACGTVDKAIERLDFMWTIFAAKTPIEAFHNQMMATLLSWKSKGVPFPGANPNGVQGEMALASLAMLGARPEYLGFPALLNAVCPHFESIDWEKVATADRRVVVGAIEVISGNFETFDSDKTLEAMGLHPNGENIEQYNSIRWRMRRPFTFEGVAASGTLPELLPAQKINNTVFPSCTPGKTVRRDAFYWDGLYSQNPPVRDLLDAPKKEDKPDEIWVVRINPQELHTLSDGMDLEAIRDRENDLAGNLSLNQELDHILTINRWIDRYGTANPPFDKLKKVTVRTIKMPQEIAWGMSHTTKFDRSPQHLAHLAEEGRRVARQWLADWRRLGKEFASYPYDARYPETV